MRYRTGVRRWARWACTASVPPFSSTAIVRLYPPKSSAAAWSGPTSQSRCRLRSRAGEVDAQRAVGGVFGDVELGGGGARPPRLEPDGDRAAGVLRQHGSAARAGDHG